MIVSHALGRSHVAGFGHTPPSGYDEVEVPATPLQKLVADAGLTAHNVAWVWCDTDGSEANAIRSGASLWRSGVPLYAEVGAHYGIGELVTEHFVGFLPSGHIDDWDDPKPTSEFVRYLERMTVLDNMLFVP
jgi:hypothetical protein